MSSEHLSLPTPVGIELQQLRRNPGKWIFLVGSRPLVGVLLFGVFLLTFYSLQWFGLVELRNPTALLYLLSGLVGGNLTLVTLVISINQVIISRQLSSPGELRERIQNVNQYRQDIFEEDERNVVPVTPSDFLKVLLESIRRDLQRFGGLTAGSDDEQMREDVDAVVTDLTDHVDRVTRLIEATGNGTFNTLSAMLTTNYADRIYEIRQVRASHEENLSETALEALEDIVSKLQEIDVARQYFRTLYIQTELAYISRMLLYAGVVTEVVLLSALLMLTSSSGTTRPESIPLAAAPLLAAVGLLPLAVLFSYVLRLAVVTQRTAAITPFTTPEQDDEINF